MEINILNTPSSKDFHLVSARRYEIISYQKQTNNYDKIQQ